MTEEQRSHQDALDYALMLGRLQGNHSFTPRQFKLFKQSLKHRPEAVDLHVNGDGIDGVIGRVFRDVHEECDGNISRVSRRLKISRSTANVWAGRFLATILMLFAANNAGAQIKDLTDLLRAASASVVVPSQSITLAWDASPSSDVTGYRIYYGPASGVYTNSVTVGNTTTTTISGLTAGVRYYFAATAHNAEGDESLFSNEAFNTPPPLLSLSVERLRLQWAALAGTSYQVQWKTTGTNWNTYATFLSGTNTIAVYLVTNDAPSKLWRVKL